VFNVKFFKKKLGEIIIN